MLKSLSGRFLFLTIVFVMLSEVLIFVPSIAQFRADFLIMRIERAQIASLALLADDIISTDLEKELLENADVFNVVLRRDESRELILSSDMPMPVSATFDMRKPGAAVLIRDALARLINPDTEIIRVIGYPKYQAGTLIELTLSTAPLREEMIAFGLRVLLFSAVISIFTGMLLLLVLRQTIVLPIKRVVGQIQAYAHAPEDARRIISPASGISELREAEYALKDMQSQLTSALKQKERLAQLGEAVAKISHDLRNILTTVQLFSDSLGSSADPRVSRLAPKLVTNVARAISLTEGTLAFGKAEEPPPRLSYVQLGDIFEEVMENEQGLCESDDITFKADLPAGMVIRADPEQLHRAITNLVRNARQAIEATSKKGEIILRGYETDIDWVVDVSDSGPGLPEKARTHLFRAFQGRVRTGGTGLGLAISQELIRGHGGVIELLRSDEQGTCFRMRLPKGRLSDKEI